MLNIVILLKVTADLEMHDVYVKDTLRASLPPILSTVSEEGSTPSTRGKSAKLAAGTCVRDCALYIRTKELVH